jgi:hypothetical protein
VRDRPERSRVHRTPRLQAPDRRTRTSRTKPGLRVCRSRVAADKPRTTRSPTRRLAPRKQSRTWPLDEVRSPLGNLLSISVRQAGNRFTAKVAGKFAGRLAARFHAQFMTAVERSATRPRGNPFAAPRSPVSDPKLEKRSAGRDERGTGDEAGTRLKSWRHQW